MNKSALGHYGETFAASVLEEKGYRILTRNFRCKEGEIDLIAEKGQRLCFIEVKTRQSVRFGVAAESVTKEKQRRIRRSAAIYLRQHPQGQKKLDFQVMEIYIHHIFNAF